MVWQPRQLEAKKLTGAVEYWLGADQKENDELLEDAARYNIQIERPIEKDYEIWEEHWQIFEIFTRLQTQWRFLESRAIGIDYSTLFELLSLYAVSNRQQAFSDFQILEAKAVEIFNKRAEKAQKEAEAKAKRRR